jgi:GT2 family glycosyltransferase
MLQPSRGFIPFESIVKRKDHSSTRDNPAYINDNYNGGIGYGFNRDGHNLPASVEFKTVFFLVMNNDELVKSRRMAMEKGP